MNTYEIHDLTTNEILVDRLEFEDMPELLEAYTNFYPNHEIVACYREYDDVCITINPAKHFAKKYFKTEWFNLVEENLANFY